MLKVKTDAPIFTSREKITHGIATFWDKVSDGWNKVYGPHIHHGYYDEDTITSHLNAQERLLERLTEELCITYDSHILDVGCGMGGSSAYLAQKYQARVTGITLSIRQLQIANEQINLKKLNKVEFKIEDALCMQSFHANTFDIVWSLESCEQFYDKKTFIDQAHRVLKPGGIIILATWCSDREEYEQGMAKKYLKLCQAFDLPYMPTMDHYAKLLSSQEWKLLRTMDWSQQVMKSWDVGMSLVSKYSFFKLIHMAGLRGLRFVWQIKLMREAFYSNRVKYGVFLARKCNYPSEY